jgi:DNA-binding NarL/FixJ family response regulator
MLCQGLTWFSPPMMADALELARQTLDQDQRVRHDALEPLTSRERQIAADVASGKSNREIAEVRHITERTVKAHLTRIFRKLGTRNRHALAMKLRGS